MFANHIYLIYTYKQALSLKYLQWLICHKTQNQIKPNPIYLIYIHIQALVFKKTYNVWYAIKPSQTKLNQILYIQYV